MQGVVVWWMKRDLRFNDNMALDAALRAAAQQNCSLVALWITEPEALTADEFHVRREKFVSECLAELESRLRPLNVSLLIAEGRATEVFNSLLTQGLRFVFSHEETGVLWTFKRDLQLKDLFKSSNVIWTEFPTNGVVRGLKDRSRWQGVRQARLASPMPPEPSSVCREEFSLERLLTLAVSNQVRFFSWSERRQTALLRAAAQATQGQQRGGESVAQGLLGRFLSADVHPKYLLSISKPHDARYFSSRLSPFLAFGCISSKQIHARLSSHEQPLDSRSIKAFNSRLAWRCHFIQKLENFPEMEVREQNSALVDLRPEMSAEDFERWHHGQTGFPLVDACLRSVHQTGFLNFRMRAMLMSFATHLMWRDWRRPAWDLAQAFLDFEAGIHFSQVHMQASVTGNNQIRIYNPQKQSEENDPDARFIRQWVPELRDVPLANIHVGEGLPAKYPKPMLELKSAMAHAREQLFKKFRDTDVRAEAKKVQEQLGSRGGPLSWRGRRSKQKKAVPKSLFDED